MAANNSGSPKSPVEYEVWKAELGYYLETVTLRTDGFSLGEAPLGNILAQECNEIDNNPEAPTSAMKKNLKNVM